MRSFILSLFRLFLLEKMFHLKCYCLTHKVFLEVQKYILVLFPSCIRSKYPFLLGCLKDAHLLDLSRRITSTNDLEDLGLNILQFDDYQVDNAKCDGKNSINKAAHELLKKWRNNQVTREAAFSNLYRALRNHGWKHLAGLLNQWSNGAVEQGIDSRFHIKFFFDVHWQFSAA